jgi:hypothetical protein
MCSYLRDEVGTPGCDIAAGSGRITGAEEVGVSRWWSGTVVVAMALVGFVVALSSGQQESALWPAWVALAAGLCGVAGVVGLYGITAWRAVSRLRPLPWRKTWLRMWATGGGGVVLLAVTEVLAGPGWRGDLLALLTIVAGGCAGLAIFGVGTAAETQPVRAGDLPGLESAVVELVRLRRRLQQLSAALGGLVALAAVTLGVGMLLGDEQSSWLVVIFSVAGSAVVGTFHAKVAAIIRGCGERVAGLVFGSTEPADVPDLVDRLEQRGRLEQLLGVQRSLFSDLQSAIPVLGPLIAVGTVFLPH